MAGDVRTPVSGDNGARAHVVIESTGTELDGRRAELVAVVDPATGLPASFGSVGVSGGSVTAADGALYTIGATADTASANTVIGRLKKLLSVLPAALTGSGNLKTAILEALPAGANVVGGVTATVANGADVAQGTTTDSSSTNTVIGLLKAVKSNTTAAATAAQTASYATTGPGATVNVTANPVQAFSAQVTSVTAGALATSWTVNVEGSLDGTNWVTVLSHQNPTDAESAITHAAGVPVRYLRANVNALTLGADATAISVSLLGTS